MNRIANTLLFLTLLLGACSTTPPPAETLPPQEPVLTESPIGTVTVSENSGQVEAGREAVVSEIENDVTARSTSDAEFTPATDGMILQEGGGIQTHNDSRARIDMMPEGTIIRVGPNSSFIIPEITVENGQPKTTLALLFGKVYVLLNGGSLDVKTPSGVASVRGSLLSVQYNPLTNKIKATCLEGHCAVKNKNGQEAKLIEGESAFIDEEGNISDIGEIDQDEIELWLEENPDLIEYIVELPDPNDYPDYPDEEWYWNEEEQTGEEVYWDEVYWEDWYLEEGSIPEGEATQEGSTPPPTEAPVATELPTGATEAPAATEPSTVATEPPAEEPPAEEPPTDQPSTDNNP